MGRIDDYVLTRDNRKIGRLDHIYKGLTNIKEGQIIQMSKGECVLKIVKADKTKQIDENSLINNFKALVGSDMTTRIEYKNEIDKGKNGKFKAVINNSE